MGENSLGRMIRRGRETLGFSQARLGELVGRSASTIRNWERGKSTPASPSDAVALAAVLGLDERRVVEAAGFEPADADSHQTVEQAYASLSRRGPAEEEPDQGDGQDRPVEATSGGRVPGWSRSVAGFPTAAADKEPDPSEADPEPDDSSPGPGSPSSFLAPASATAGRVLTAVRSALQPQTEPEREEEGGVARAAPPTVLETAPPAEPSYVEDPEERQRYRARAVATAAVVIFLFIVLLWSFDRATDALGAMWQDFVGMLEL